MRDQQADFAGRGYPGIPGSLEKFVTPRVHRGVDHDQIRRGKVRGLMPAQPVIDRQAGKLGQAAA
jgi:hypothetical protein